MTKKTARETKALVLGTPLPLDRHPVSVYLASLSPSSRRVMRESLNIIAAMLTADKADALTTNWSAIRFQHAAAIRTKLAERYSPASANRMLAALRGVLSATFNLGQMSAEDYLRAKEIKAVRGKSLSAGRALTAEELESLFAVCASDSSPAGMRDGALLAVARVAGLRRAELAAIELKDYNAAQGSILIRGKGNKQRIVYAKNGATRWLKDWLAIRGKTSGPLFCPILKSGKVLAGERLSPQSIFDILAKRAAQAGIKDISPHDLRRTFISDLLDAGADISTVQKLSGHESIQTTTRYDRRRERAKVKAVELLNVPYPARKPIEGEK
jgi:site-specific recombinase XerD